MFQQAGTWYEKHCAALKAKISPPEGSDNIATLYLQKWRPGRTLRETAHTCWPGDVCFSLYTTNSSGTVSCFSETSALTITNIFSQRTSSSGKNAVSNEEKKNLRIHFPLSLGKSEWTNGSTSFQHQNSCYILYSGFLTLMRTAHRSSLYRDHCTMAKKPRPRTLAMTRMHFHHMLSEITDPK